ncbi:MAG: hypothetical protein JWM16_263 [Verrucomicrobiales bacterium]|nr:hypothetical protein [Verrucomicrobiales bacterium]
MAKSKPTKNGQKLGKASAEPLVQVDDPIYQKYGQPIYLNENGKIEVNQTSVVRKFAADEKIGVEPAKGTLVKYTQGTGEWSPAPSTMVKGDLAEFMRKMAEEYKQMSVAFKTKPIFLNSLKNMLEVVAPQITPQDQEGLVLVKNGVLDLTGNKPAVKEFSPDYGFTTALSLAYKPTAKCTRFLNDLLKPALGPDDVSLVQRYFGSVLLGTNASQRILVLKGTPGGGKSTLVSVLERVIGLDRISYLRSSHLDGRFEFGGFLGKRMLTGKDVPGDVLSVNGAKLLKSLVGGDLLEGEIKYVADKKQLVGNFHVVIACNNNLRIALDGDDDAWRRRLLLVQFDRPKPAVPVVDLAEQLINEEAEGILAWLVEGAIQHSKELKQNGNFKLTADQQLRIDDLIDASQSVSCFVRKGLELKADSKLTVQQIVDGYQAYCKDRKWVPLTERQVENALGGIMLKELEVTKRNDVVLPDTEKAVRGFVGVGFVE